MIGIIIIVYLLWERSSGNQPLAPGPIMINPK